MPPFNFPVPGEHVIECRRTPSDRPNRLKFAQILAVAAAGIFAILSSELTCEGTKLGPQMGVGVCLESLAPGVSFIVDKIVFNNFE